MNHSMKNDDIYYMLYEDRYRRIYSQGIEYWISDPEENARVMSSIEKFLDYACCQPSTTCVIEFGCGEGYVASYLLECGFGYLGVDISESAILKARERTGAKGQNAFLRGDITDLHQVPSSSYDVAIDNSCFQMLVTDDHRAKYLAEVKRILKSNGKAYFRENIQEEEFKQKISDFREFVETFDGDYTTLHDYPAFVDGKRHIIKLPRVPARFNNEQGYRRELEEAGFIVDNYSIERWQCIIHASVR